MRDDYPVSPMPRRERKAYPGDARFPRWTTGPAHWCRHLACVQRMLFHKIEAPRSLKAARIAWPFFGDAEQTVDAVVAFGIFDAAGAHQRRVSGCAVGKISMLSM